MARFREWKEHVKNFYLADPLFKPRLSTVLASSSRSRETVKTWKTFTTTEEFLKY